MSKQKTAFDTQDNIKVNNDEETAATLGEHKIIEIMQSFFEPMPNLTVPFGDDISVVSIPVRDQVTALKTDMLVAKTDVPQMMSMWHAARKAMVMTISDFAAKGIQPTAALIAVGIPKNFYRQDIENIAKGLNAGARQYGAYIIGGDTNEASDLIVSVHLYGTSQKNGIMLRKGAKPGDIVAVTGAFGNPSAGLKLLLEKNNTVTDQKLYTDLLNTVFMPNARLNEGLALRQVNAVTASMDSSDGLAWSLHELAKQNNVGFTITELPIADEAKRFAEENRLNIDELVLYGGEEYELVVTIDPAKWHKAQTSVESIGGKLLAIGKTTSEKKIIHNIDNKERPIIPKGWQHFSVSTKVV